MNLWQVESIDSFNPYSMSEVTRILEAYPADDPEAAEKLLPLVYGELRKLAAARMANESLGQTLQTTALVHEAWIRLVGGTNRSWENRGHFFSAAAEAMRRILIERARRRTREKHGGGLKKINLENLELTITVDDPTLLLVDEALEKLKTIDPKGAELIRLRFLAGLNTAP